MFDTVLIANRGAIACRVIRSLHALGLKAVAVYSEADADARHVAMADQAVCIGPAPAAQSYLNAERILAAARETGAGAIHPGYGFLSENPGFADACEAAGLAFIGPSAAQMRAFGLKHTARELALQHGVPLLPGSGLLRDAEEAGREAARIGYPVMLKSTAGGGGIGMRLVRSEPELAAAWEAVARLAQANFKDAGLFVEKFVEHARHIEVQIFGDGQGRVVALGERDCSAQRRNQKVIEETPAPHLAPATREALLAAAVRLGQAVSYRSAGTVEYVLDAESGEFYFLEVNTRLQVEHGVTEQVTGIDLVAWMVKLARGEAFALEAPAPRGASIQVRLYAEDPARNFQPCAGLLTEVVFPDDARVDGWVEAGTEVPASYDPMLAKLIVTAETREAAVVKLRAALAATRLAGIETNLRYLRHVAAQPVFEQGRIVTRSLGELRYQPQALEVLEPGVQTSVQDWPGRTGHWAVGVPPSGPMDDQAMRIANRLVGNASDAAALECTLTGPSLRFHGEVVFAVTGAAMGATLDGEPVALWAPHAAKPGSVLKLAAVEGGGARSYLAVRGGFDVPLYLGSRATFALGQFGGHGGRTLRAGDMLHVGGRIEGEPAAALPSPPGFTHHWDIGVLYGPHGAPDFFTPDDIATFFATDWQVHYNSSRTGVRLVGPKPQWARHDGGEAGLHPSNLHDNAYAIGAIDFTGDMPVILGPDGPSLGGFVCPAVVHSSERWKLGQLKPGDTLRFRCVDVEGRRCQPDTPVLLHEPADGDRPEMVIRQAGDRYVLVEFGEQVLDIELRFRVHALMLAMQQRDLAGVIDLTPGIRSLQVHFDPAVLSRRRLLHQLQEAEHALPPSQDFEVPSRTVWLPLSWDDAATRLAIDRYMQSVRSDAPWCPSNIEFIRRINGLESVDEVWRTVFEARYLVMGLGDVYLGAPVATPVDPRHRLVTTKYNPARTWTPENAVGIGGAYLCVYGMEGPGGYQFVGRTVQMWNRWRDASQGALEFEPGKPWLLRFFDQIRFYPVSEDELLQMRRDLPAGRLRLRIEEGRFGLREVRELLATESVDIERHKARQQQAFEAERDRWHLAGTSEAPVEEASAPVDNDALPVGARGVSSPVPGSVWNVAVREGDEVAAGATLIVVESMKMEFPVIAPRAGRVLRVHCREGGAVASGQQVVVLQLEADDG
ncbi:MAG TPA: 5-oxoprolinase/urea amidolyase family protein [Ideonella sp.]|nr:5-oxoprolinase/urea amidolyase family protein [Ideonella sp.]